MSLLLSKNYGRIVQFFGGIRQPQVRPTPHAKIGFARANSGEEIESIRPGSQRFARTERPETRLLREGS